MCMHVGNGAPHRLRGAGDRLLRVHTRAGGQQEQHDLETRTGESRGRMDSFPQHRSSRARLVGRPGGS